MPDIIRVIKGFHAICCYEIPIVVLILIQFIIITSLFFCLSNRSILPDRIFFRGKSNLICFFEYTPRIISIWIRIIFLAFLILKNVNCWWKIFIILSRLFLYRWSRWVEIILNTLAEVFLIYLFRTYICSCRNSLNCFDYRQTLFIYSYFRASLI